MEAMDTMRGRAQAVPSGEPRARQTRLDDVYPYPYPHPPERVHALRRVDMRTEAEIEWDRQGGHETCQWRLRLGREEWFAS